MKTKLITILGCALLVSSCGGKNSDGSDKTTYSSCSITESSALLASDRARDISQCWDGVDIEEKSLALDWCGKKASAYMGRYLIGHSYKIKVASTNCP